MEKLKKSILCFLAQSFLPLLLLMMQVIVCSAQQKDSTQAITDTTIRHKVKADKPVAVDTVKGKTDSVHVKVHSPRKAAIYSAILPGLGQIYNKKYWKLPIVYGALGITGAVFIYNYKNYKDTRFAYKVRYNERVFQTDSASEAKIKPALKPLTEESLRFYRDQFRRDIDFSALIFILLWGLNVVDATVDAHLKSFDVTPDLSMRFRAGYSEMAGTNGVSLVFSLRK